jgi:hypothetical protein
MKFFGRTAGYTIFYHRRNEEFLEQLKEEPVDKKLRRQKSNWLWKATNINNRMPKIILNYGSNGRRRLARPVKRRLEEGETDLDVL